MFRDHYFPGREEKRSRKKKRDSVMSIRLEAAPVQPSARAATRPNFAQLIFLACQPSPYHFGQNYGTCTSAAQGWTKEPGPRTGGSASGCDQNGISREVSNMAGKMARSGELRRGGEEEERD
ncbi:hypothetical protein Pmani_010124 [Petrolisthes manimaculis]|uniref:Uncharacterized protein n=1 Tax=Petrolisthes manimaculis TaxID=1843537 RepID=A0AAE1Q3P7_9EUCA|nr:hypothetical protein Pmani_010124 [Petrolisthes manimaculis]